MDSNESYTIYSKGIPNTDVYTVYSSYKNYNSPIHILKGGYKLNLPKGNGNSNNDNHTGTHHRGMGTIQLYTRSNREKERTMRTLWYSNNSDVGYLDPEWSEETSVIEGSKGDS